MRAHSTLVLVILDGFGYNDKTAYNAIAKANTPTWDKWWATYPHILLDASGHSVGLPDAQMGNSEVGHMHMGAGRVIYQDFTRINEAIADNTFFTNKTFIESLSTLKKDNASLHLMGLLSDGGVHSHQDHLFALLKLCHEQDFQNVYLHLFLDGRDTPPQSASTYLTALENALKQYPVATIASLSGRYYAMDRDKRWERVQPCYQLLTEGVSPQNFDSAETALLHYYQQNINDEFIPPTRIGTPHPIKNNDAVLFFNFRADRARQLTECFINPIFEGFNREKCPQLSAFISMTQYAKTLPTKIAFPPQALNNTFGEVLARHHLKQLRLAETEKYAHVTFFFNGGIEAPFPGEARILIPSPKVATYDLKPEMSADEITRSLRLAIEALQFDVIICNYANADMVGHSGNIDATIKAIECLDKQFSAMDGLVAKGLAEFLITADHGNAEMMYDETCKQPHTAHTHCKVPLLYVGHNPWIFNQSHGSLTDIAPTLLTLLGINSPKDMTGRSLLNKKG